MSFIIDRRLNSKKKSAVNRQRFLKRYRRQIKKAVEESLKKRSIQDLQQGEDITIARDCTAEPIFQHGKGGTQTRVYPGNKEFITGDEFPRPPGGAGSGGSGSGDASNEGIGEDEFTFHINQEEFLDFMFEGLELPNLVKKQLKSTASFEVHQAGFTSNSSPEKLHLTRSLRVAYARRIALSGASNNELSALRKELWQLESEPVDEISSAKRKALKAQITLLQANKKRVPFLDTYDLRYRNYVRTPIPSTKAVIICIMDVSGSMTQNVKELAKRFFILLYLFIQRNYQHTEVLFIRHHTRATEVDEQEFFYSRETGGTIVSSALELAADIIEQRFPQDQYNVYVAQASDGDNWDNDSETCHTLLKDKILPMIQYFAYVEITSGAHQNLWYEYEKLQRSFKTEFCMQQVRTSADIYPVFRELFSSNID
ncbi:MAG: YeaH/YhbH family protein [Oceanospirillaceae bacterium]|nr:YeaH/YhbH family protein [Oceanospirillaceae bacterium]